MDKYLSHPPRRNVGIFIRFRSCVYDGLVTCAILQPLSGTLAQCITNYREVISICGSLQLPDILSFYIGVE